MVYRIYAEKKPGVSPESAGVLADLRDFLGVKALEEVRILNRYDVDHIDRAVFDEARSVVFSEPQVDTVYDETFSAPEGQWTVLAVEALPGQFDQRADSAAQCIQLMAGVERPLVSYAKVYLLRGDLTAEDIDKISGYVINPVESRRASMDKPETLARTYAVPDHVQTVEGFIAMDEAQLAALLDRLGLA